jgi:salicylate biosynthesis isochorismate synthase
MSLLSPARAGALERRIRDVSREARAAGRTLLMLHAERLDDAPPALELLEGAAREGLARFFVARPSQGFELVALGCAARLSARSAAGVRRLRARADALRGQLRPAPGGDAPGPLWVGGLAFDPQPAARAPHWRAYGSAHFVLPELALLRRGGEVWLRFALEVDARTDGARAMQRWEEWLAKHGPAPLHPASPRLSADARAATRYRAAVEQAIDAMRAGAARKVVLACEEHHAVSVSSEAALQALLAAHPSSLIFAQGLGDSVFLGATPELLIRRAGARVETSAVAATARRGRSESAARTLARRLQRSAKERLEHALVVEDLAERLRPLCSELAVPGEPVLLDTGTLQHLLTPIEGRLREPVHALDLALRVHPTPALGGAPRAQALELIRSLEGFDRGGYGGPIGWFDADGNGEFCVALRCALIEPGALRLFAGSGLVADSRPESEARETALKLASVRSALETP